VTPQPFFFLGPIVRGGSPRHRRQSPRALFVAQVLPKIPPGPPSPCKCPPFVRNLAVFPSFKVLERIYCEHGVRHWSWRGNSLEGHQDYKGLYDHYATPLEVPPPSLSLILKQQPADFRKGRPARQVFVTFYFPLGVYQVPPWTNTSLTHCLFVLSFSYDSFPIRHLDFLVGCREFFRPDPLLTQVLECPPIFDRRNCPMHNFLQ